MKVPNEYRVKRGMFGSDDGFGCNGAFEIPIPLEFKKLNRKMLPGALAKQSEYYVMASDEGGWEHVSVSLKGRCLTWGEMCFIKSLFWSEDETVIQYHPPKSEYVNNHETTLHLWRPIGQEIPLPPSIYVGIK